MAWASVMKTGGQLLIRRRLTSSKPPDPCPGKTLPWLCPLNSGRQFRSTGPAQSDRHNIAIQRPGIGADSHRPILQQEMGRQDAGCHPRELKFFYGQAVDHETSKGWSI